MTNMDLIKELGQCIVTIACMPESFVNAMDQAEIVNHVCAISTIISKSTNPNDSNQRCEAKTRKADILEQSNCTPAPNDPSILGSTLDSPQPSELASSKEQFVKEKLSSCQFSKELLEQAERIKAGMVQAYVPSKSLKKGIDTQDKDVTLGIIANEALWEGNGADTPYFISPQDFIRTVRYIYIHAPDFFSQFDFDRKITEDINLWNNDYFLDQLSFLRHNFSIERLCHIIMVYSFMHHKDFADGANHGHVISEQEKSAISNQEKNLTAQDISQDSEQKETTIPFDEGSANLPTSNASQSPFARFITWFLSLFNQPNNN